MTGKRVFKTKTFDRWARKLLPDRLLCRAAREIEQGLFEADLGHGVCKKRIAVAGQGKSGSTRTLVAKRHPGAIVFLLGREKSDAGSDFSDAVLNAVKVIADDLQSQPLQGLESLMDKGLLKEICHGSRAPK